MTEKGYALATVLMIYAIGVFATGLYHRTVTVPKIKKECKRMAERYADYYWETWMAEVIFATFFWPAALLYVTSAKFFRIVFGTWEDET